MNTTKKQPQSDTKTVYNVICHISRQGRDMWRTNKRTVISTSLSKNEAYKTMVNIYRHNANRIDRQCRWSGNAYILVSLCNVKEGYNESRTYILEARTVTKAISGAISELIANSATDETERIISAYNSGRTDAADNTYDDFYTYHPRASKNELEAYNIGQTEINADLSKRQHLPCYLI